MTILYADDDPEDCELIFEALNDIDPSISCIVANDGSEALKILRQSKKLPDYIFLDINMPVMDGKECLAKLKNDSRLREIPVIICSTTTNTEEIGKLYTLGAFDFISKANSFTELCKSLDQVINKLKAYRGGLYGPGRKFEFFIRKC